MKKHLLLLSIVLFSIGTFAQDTITGWTFPVNSGPDSLNANLGTTQNKSYDIRFEWESKMDTTVNTIFFYDEGGNYAAETNGWDNGADIKFWSCKFKAENYKNFKVSSKQKSETGFPGPRDFKLQWRLSKDTVFTDIPNSVLTLTYDYANGTLSNLPVPVTGQGSSSIYIRWIMTSNTDVDGGTVAPTGRSIIDDILVTGTSTLGTDEIIYTNRVKFFPVNGSRQYQVESTVPMASLTITDIQGKNIYSEKNPGMNASFNIDNASNGLYLITIKFTDTDKPYVRKFIVQ